MRRPLAAAFVCLATLTACSSSEGGAATPQSTTESTSPTSSSTRPREIRLDGKNPCDLMTAEQLAAIAETTTPKLSTVDTFKSPSCNFNTNGAFWTITTVVTEGIDAWTSGKRNGRPADIPAIAGFPSITVTLPTDKVACDLAVDVADGQYLFAGFEVSESFADRFPKPCDGARQVAEAAMQNLTK